MVVPLRLVMVPQLLPPDVGLGAADVVAQLQPVAVGPVAAPRRLAVLLPLVVDVALEAADVVAQLLAAVVDVARRIRRLKPRLWRPSEPSILRRPQWS